MRTGFILLSLSSFAAAIVAVACSASSSGIADTADAGDSTVMPASSTGSTPSSSPPSGPAGTGLATGLPCDVQAILENRCLACHSGANPPPLVDYASLTAPSTADPTKTRAQLSLERMQAKLMPPAPAVPPEDDEIASFEAWVKAGSPKNEVACTDPPPAQADGGAADAGGADAGVKCTSGKFWANGEEGRTMRPGNACNACHQTQGGPNLRVAGTVYPSLHEPNDCIGSAPPPQLRVVVTDSRNRVFNMEVNASGNFLTKGGERPRPPLKAMITDGTKTRAMAGSVTSGDCNSCHTVAGLNGAPGRIMAP